MVLSRFTSYIYIYFFAFLITLNIGLLNTSPPSIEAQNSNEVKDGPPFNGVNMHGFYTRTAQARDGNNDLPPNYFDESLKIISTSGMNHVRFPFFWEAYVKNPNEFIQELETVAAAADKYNVKVLYDNHQFHTSSYLNPQRGTGFPFALFEGDFSFFYGSGGGTKYPTAKVW